MTTNASPRRILLVDNDRAFHELLAEQIGPYGFEVVPASPADPDVLAKVTQLDPALLIIAVDEPDKVGYSLCNKAKKGVAAKLPVILATATVSPEGFANHRKLKIHADEYIDKRGLNPAEVVGKIDNLIGLGDLVVAAETYSDGDGYDDELQVPVEVEDVPLDLADAEVVEQLDDLDEFAEGGNTAIAPPRVVDALLEADLEGAFAAITDDDDPDAAPARGRRTEPPPLPVAPREAAPPSDLDLDVPTNRPGAKLETRPSDYVVDEPSMGIPEPIADSALASKELEAEEAPAEWSGEVPEPIEAGDFPEERTSTSGPPLTDMLRPEPMSPLPEAEDAEPAAAVPEPVPAPEPEPAPPPPAPPAEPAGIDLGLDEIAARADAEQSGMHDRRALQKLHVLERENARLKAELDKARQAAGDASKSRGREREFLHLREMIAGKDKEILELRDELVSRDRQILDSREKLRQLQHVKVQLEGKNLELEQRIVGDADRVEAAESARKEVEVRLADATARLAAVEAKAKADADAHARTLAERTQQAAQLDRELTAARARLSEVEHKQAEALAAATRIREAEVAQAKAEGERAMGAALVAQRDELESAHARAVADLEARHAEALAARDEERGAAVAAAVREAEERAAEAAQRLAAELEAAKAEAERALIAERARAEQALAAARARHDEELAAERARAEQAVADAARRAQEVTEAERARADKAIAEAQTRAQEDMVAVVAAHQGEMEKAAGEHHAALSALRAQHETELAQTRAAAVAERDRLAGEHAAAIAVLTEDRDRVQAELDETRVEGERLRGEVASAREEKAQVERGLSSARDRIRELEGELAAARDATAQRERTIAERDARLAQLQGELDALEKENAGYQEQVLKAYQKIKADEATVARAKKAMAIALTLLDEDGKPKSEGA